MPKTGTIRAALGVFLAAILTAALYERAAPYGLYTPPPSTILTPPGLHTPPCYASLTRRERDKGLRHWSGMCRPWG